MVLTALRLWTGPSATSYTAPAEYAVALACCPGEALPAFGMAAGGFVCVPGDTDRYTMVLSSRTDSSVASGAGSGAALALLLVLGGTGLHCLPGSRRIMLGDGDVP
jgi:hypothetical protein